MGCAAAESVWRPPLQKSGGGSHRVSGAIAPPAGAARVKRVFIRSGIRFDYLLEDKDESFFKELVEHHVSGQLKVAPEHCSAAVLRPDGETPYRNV